MPGSSPVRFGIPVHAQDAWGRLAAAVGSASDIDKVLRALGQLWPLNSSDPRAFESWLSDQGIDKKFADREVLQRAKDEFDSYENAKRAESKRLIEGVASGPNAREFFLAVHGYPLELKEIAFQTGLSISKDINLVLLLAALAREDDVFIQSCLNSARVNPIIENFFSYTRARSRQIRIPTPPIQRNTVPTETKSATTTLFQLVSLSPTQLHSHLQALSRSEATALVAAAERLFPLLPEEGYGESIRRQITFFMCLASPNHPIADNAVEFLKRSTEQPEGDLLIFLGSKRTAALFSDLVNKRDASHSSLAAAALDSLRRYYPDALSDLAPRLINQARESRNPTLSLSAAAASLQLSQMDDADFRGVLLKALKLDKEKIATQWLAGNPEFLDSTPIGKLSSRVLSNLLEDLAKKQPARLVSFIRSSLSIANEKNQAKLWSASVHALEHMEPSLGTELFVDLATRHAAGSLETIQRYLTQGGALSFLSDNVWAVAERIHEEKVWSVLFDAVSLKISKPSILGWIKTASRTQADLTRWVLESYLPRLLERELLQSNFVAELPDPQLQALLVKGLGARALHHIRSLKTITAEWPKMRRAEKDKLAHIASVGLRISKQTAKNNQALESKLTNLRKSIEQWHSSESPTLDPTINSAAEIKLTDTQPPNRELLNAFFTSRSVTPHDTCLFFGANPWGVDLLLGPSDSSWPKLEFLVEQIAKSLAFFANLNERATKLMKELQTRIKVDFAIALREGLDEIEEVLAGYFAFRSMLHESGLEQAEPFLGRPLDQQDVSSDKHKLLRDPSQAGRLRVFSLGLKVNDRVVGSSKVMKSGDVDDRD